jgi:hypothetical protein
MSKAWLKNLLLCFAIATAALISYQGVATAREIDPSVNFCQAIDGLEAGEELLLKPGDYQGPCKIRRGGEPGRPLVIRAADLNQRPRILYNARGGNALEIHASHVTIRGLELGPTQPDIDAIRIFSGEDIVIEDCVFRRVGGIAVVATHQSVRGLFVRRNTISNSSATAMYFGCHDGNACAISDLLIERNLIEGIDAPPDQVGYGIQVKLNSSGIIRENVIVGTKGPPIMVYGAQDASKGSLVEKNYVSGSRTSSGIVVGGGPVVVRGNVAKNNAEAGIALEDYGKRGLLRGLVISANKVADNQKGGILAPDGVNYRTEAPIESTAAPVR